MFNQTRSHYNQNRAALEEICLLGEPRKLLNAKCYDNIKKPSNLSATTPPSGSFSSSPSISSRSSCSISAALSSTFHQNYEELLKDSPPNKLHPIPPKYSQTAPNPLINSSYVLKQNRILANFKKLKHFEKYLLRSRDFVKKNLDIIHAQIKASANRKRVLSHQVHSSQDDVVAKENYEINSSLYCDLNLNEQLVCNQNPVKIVDEKLVKKSSRRSRGKSKSKRQKKSSETRSEANKNKGRNRIIYLDETNFAAANQAVVDRDYEEKLKSDFLFQHNEIKRSSTAKRKELVFTSIDFLKFKKKATFDLLNSIENVLNINNSTLPASQNRQNKENSSEFNNVNSHSYSSDLKADRKNAYNDSSKSKHEQCAHSLNTRNIEFSKSMIEFKLQLRGILVKIEQVT